jgi:hypothetical protein
MVALCSLFAGGVASAQEDFLTEGEVSAIRDAQEPDKRIVAYLDFAQRRLDAVRTNLASAMPNLGRAVQKSLAEYVHILEALDGTIADARERRVPVSKGLQQVEQRGSEFLKYLESINVESSPGWKDYQFSIDEAIDMTRDELDVAGQGSFPELQERTPPADLPARPTPRGESEEGPDQQGPPRKSRSSS